MLSAAGNTYGCACRLRLGSAVVIDEWHDALGLERIPRGTYATYATYALRRVFEMLG